MTIEEMLQRKRELGYTYETISERADLPLGTVQKVLGGVTKSPRYDTIKALEKVLGPQAWEQTAHSGSDSFSAAGLVRESEKPYNASNTAGTSAIPYVDSYPLLPYKRQGDYTAEDRNKLPEEVRTELIDGVIYDMASPKAIHQITVSEVFAQIRQCILDTEQDCLAFISPSDVWINRDDKNILQPDIYVICDYSMIGKDGYTKGAPPFVIEVLSPSTRSRDMLLKAYKYCTSGVKEYWIVDPIKRWIRTYDYEVDPSGTEYTEYGFNEKVPIRISKGKCSVDFSAVSSVLEKILK